MKYNEIQMMYKICTNVSRCFVWMRVKVIFYFICVALRLLYTTMNKLVINFEFVQTMHVCAGACYLYACNVFACVAVRVCGM